jgi:hypothetical protein
MRAIRSQLVVSALIGLLTGSGTTGPASSQDEEHEKLAKQLARWPR